MPWQFSRGIGIIHSTEGATLFRPTELVGTGAVIMNGAVIGEGSIVGANALVTEGKVFPPHSMILGAPAKAVRTLDADTVAAIGKGATHYVENARRYAGELEIWEPGAGLGTRE